MQQNAMNVADRIFVHPIFSTSILSFRLTPLIWGMHWDSLSDLLWYLPKCDFHP